MHSVRFHAPHSYRLYRPHSGRSHASQWLLCRFPHLFLGPRLPSPALGGPCFGISSLGPIGPSTNRLTVISLLRPSLDAVDFSDPARRIRCCHAPRHHLSAAPKRDAGSGMPAGVSPTELKSWRVEMTGEYEDESESGMAVQLW